MSQKAGSRLKSFVAFFVLSVIALILLILTGCVSIATHERMLRETRDREVEYAQKLAVELEHGEISIRDMEWLLHGRCE